MAKISTVRSQESDWQAESDLRTLLEADKIRKDAKRFAKARALAKQNMMSMATVAVNKDMDGE